MAMNKINLSAREQLTFMRISEALAPELGFADDPIDGWDPTPRPFHLDEIASPSIDNNRTAIPKGHIAMMGDFEVQ